MTHGTFKLLTGGLCLILAFLLILATLTLVP